MTLSEPYGLMTRHKWLAAGAIFLVVAACGGGGGARGIETLGNVFANAFRTDSNGEALPDPASANLVVNPNIEPFNP